MTKTRLQTFGFLTYSALGGNELSDPDYLVVVSSGIHPRRRLSRK